MRSDRVAKLAGVTVRTLRHYHQIGLLREPRRSANGYRDYSVEDLATVVRIHRFAELGIPLAEVGRVLNDAQAANALLEQIDMQAASEIEHLEGRRREIAALRRAGASPDLPTALFPYAALLRSPASQQAADDVYEREQYALLGRFVPDEGWDSLARIFEGLRTAGARHDALSRRFLELPADASADEWESLADEILDLMQGVSLRESAPVLGDEATALLMEHQANYFNSAQAQMIARIVARWTD